MTRREQTTRQKRTVMHTEAFEKVAHAPLRQPKKDTDEVKKARDAQKLQKDIQKKLDQVKLENEREAAEFEAKQLAKQRKAEKEKREQVRQRVAAEAAAEKAEKKRVRREMEAKNKEELARRADVQKKAAALAAKERKQLIKAKEAEEEYVTKALSDWQKNKKQQFEKDLESRKRQQQEEEAERKRLLRQAQKEWRTMEEARIEKERAEARKQREATTTFHEALRERDLLEELERTSTGWRPRRWRRTARQGGPVRKKPVRVGGGDRARRTGALGGAGSERWLEIQRGPREPGMRAHAWARCSAQM